MTPEEQRYPLSPDGWLEGLKWKAKRAVRKYKHHRRVGRRVGDVTVAALGDFLFHGVVAVLPVLYQGIRVWSDPEERTSGQLVMLAAWAILILTFFYYNRYKTGRALDKVAYNFGQTANRIGGQVEDLARRAYRSRLQPPVEPPSFGSVGQHLLEAIIQGVKQLTEHSGAEFSAFLFRPHDGQLKCVVHWGERPDLIYEEIGTDAPGGGVAFTSRGPDVVEDTEDPKWGPLFAGRSFKSFIGFPLDIGGLHDGCLGSVTVDSTEPYTFREEMKGRLYDSVRPQLELLSLLILIREVPPDPPEHSAPPGTEIA